MTSSLLNELPVIVRGTDPVSDSELTVDIWQRDVHSFLSLFHLPARLIGFITLQTPASNTEKYTPQRWTKLSPVTPDHHTHRVVIGKGNGRFYRNKIQLFIPESTWLPLSPSRSEITLCNITMRFQLEEFQSVAQKHTPQQHSSCSWHDFWLRRTIKIQGFWRGAIWWTKWLRKKIIYNLKCCTIHTWWIWFFEKIPDIYLRVYQSS